MHDLLLDNLAKIRAKLADKPVTLMAVTKTVSVERINLAIEKGGIRCIGENRVQELLQKYDQLVMRDELQIHLIGSLQTNKVKYIVDKVDLIHSVDSIKLINEIQKQAYKIGKVQDVLIEVNIADEETKGGISPADLPMLLERIKECSNVRWRGLMCIPPISKDPEFLSSCFNGLKKLLVDNIDKKLDNINDYILSMGMSGDYEIAVECGSTMIRLGSAIFGDRKY